MNNIKKYKEFSIIILIICIWIIIYIFMPDTINQLNINLLLFSSIIGILSTIYNFWIKTRAEIRLNESSQSENDVKLIKLFTEIIDIAHCRKNHLISEKVIEVLLSDRNPLNIDFNNIEDVKSKLELSTLIIPVGLASQEAAVVSIKELGLKYKILKEPALQGLNSLKSQNIFVDLVDKCIKEINNQK